MQADFLQIKRISPITFVYRPGGGVTDEGAKRRAKVERRTDVFGDFSELDAPSVAWNYS